MSRIMESQRLTFTWMPAPSDIPPPRTPSPRKKRLAERIRLHKSNVDWQNNLLKNNVTLNDQFSRTDAVLDDNAAVDLEAQEALTRAKNERIAKKKKIDPYFMGKADRQFVLGSDFTFLNHRSNFIFKPGKVVNPKPSKVKEEDYSEFVFANGDKYEGHFTINPTTGPLRSGVGKYVKANGSVFLGEWFADKLHGDNCYISLVSEKVKYKGGFRNGKFHGLGTYRGPEGLYQGPFWHGKFVGRGRFIDTEGFTWVGKFRCINAVNLKLHLENICDSPHASHKPSV